MLECFNNTTISCKQQTDELLINASAGYVKKYTFSNVCLKEVRPKKRQFLYLEMGSVKTNTFLYLSHNNLFSA